jgi:hypothetical protein
MDGLISDVHNLTSLRKKTPRAQRGHDFFSRFLSVLSKSTTH